MTTILRGLPYFDAGSSVVFQKRQERIKPQQIVVWVSLAEIEQKEFTTGTPRFPAVLDTGFSHNFGIRAEHLIRWAGMQPGYLPKIGDIRVNNVTASLHHADVWLHRNKPWWRDESQDEELRSASRLSQGIRSVPSRQVHARTPSAPWGLRGAEMGSGSISASTVSIAASGFSAPRQFWFYWPGRAPLPTGARLDRGGGLGSCVFHQRLLV